MRLGILHGSVLWLVIALRPLFACSPGTNIVHAGQPQSSGPSGIFSTWPSETPYGGNYICADPTRASFQIQFTNAPNQPPLGLTLQHYGGIVPFLQPSSTASTPPKASWGLYVDGAFVSTSSLFNSGASPVELPIHGNTATIALPFTGEYFFALTNQPAQAEKFFSVRVLSNTFEPAQVLSQPPAATSTFITFRNGAILSTSDNTYGALIAADGVSAIAFAFRSFLGERYLISVADDQARNSASPPIVPYSAGPADASWLGHLHDPSIPGTGDGTSVTVSARGTWQGYTVVTYFAPMDFAPPSQSTTSVRQVLITLQSLLNPADVRHIRMYIVPPPTVFIPGLWSKPTDFTSAADFFFAGLPPIPNDKSAIYPSRWSIAAYGTAEDGSPGSARDISASADVIDQEIVRLLEHLNVLDAVHSILPIEVHKVDVVAHSMGGLVTREIATFDDVIHKVITIGTPHLGSPLATALLAPGNQCIADIFSAHGDPVSGSGAIGDLQGDGHGGNLSRALTELESSDRGIPIAMTAGRLTEKQLAGIGCFIGFAPICLLTGRGIVGSIVGSLFGEPITCPKSPLSGQFNPIGLPILMGGGICETASGTVADAFGIRTPGPPAFPSKPKPAPGCGSDNSDGIVPFDSARMNRTLEDSHTFKATHSAGAREIGFGGPHLLQTPNVKQMVMQLLDLPIADGVYVTIH